MNEQNNICDLCLCAQIVPRCFCFYGQTFTIFHSLLIRYDTKNLVCSGAGASAETQDKDIIISRDSIYLLKLILYYNFKQA